ncbi:MAG TPA: SGNH/GDSL hydrolase family protein [Planctomycetaceae bacterium]|nr:SGNH/GDSL hydrolase family protein [Planctomycetaceae bacterium]
MIRFCLTCIQNTLRAILLLVVLTCVIEVGLRVYETVRATEARPLDDDSIIAGSLCAHHQLKPFLRTSFVQPDTGQSIALTTNSFGMRGPEPAVPKPPGTIRVLCLGDETVLSPETPWADLFTTRLQEWLTSRTGRTVEVLNAGVPGYCPLLSYLQLKHRLMALQPDLVIVNFDMSDVADDYRYRRDTITDASDVPLACPAPSPDIGPVSTRIAWLDQFAIGMWFKRQLKRLSQAEANAQDARDIANSLARYAWLQDDPPDWSIYIQQALGPIDHCKTLVEASGARLLLATYPAPWQVSPSASNGRGVRQQAGVPQDAFYTSNIPFRILADYARVRGVAFCDASPAFKADPHPERFYLHNAPRFSAEGHALYARQLAQAVLFLLGSRQAADALGSFPRRAGAIRPTSGDASPTRRPRRF